MTKSKASKPNSNDTEKRKTGSGGARPGAGRKPIEFKTENFFAELPEALITAMNEAGVYNRTAYISTILSKDLTKRNVSAKSKKELAKVIAYYKAKSKIFS